MYSTCATGAKIWPLQIINHRGMFGGLYTEGASQFEQGKQVDFQEVAFQLLNSPCGRHLVELPNVLLLKAIHWKALMITQTSFNNMDFTHNFGVIEESLEMIFRLTDEQILDQKYLAPTASSPTNISWNTFLKVEKFTRSPCLLTLHK